MRFVKSVLSGEPFPIVTKSSVPSKLSEAFHFPVAPLVQAAEVPTEQVPTEFWVPEAPIDRVPWLALPLQSAI